MVLKKPSDFFEKENKSGVSKIIEDVDHFDTFQSYKKNLEKFESISKFSESLEDYNENVERVNYLSQQLLGVQEEIKTLLTREDLDRAMMSQLLVVEEITTDIQSRVKTINNEKLISIKKSVKELTEQVNEFISVDVPKYKGLIVDSEKRSYSRYDKFEGRISESIETVQQSIQNSQQSIDESINDISNSVKQKYKEIDKNISEFQNKISEDLNNALMSQRFIVEQTTDDIQSKVKTINDEKLASIKESVKNLTEQVNEFISVDVPKYKSLVIDSEKKAYSRYDKFEGRISESIETVQQSIQNSQQSIDDINNSVDQKYREIDENILKLQDKLTDKISSVKKTVSEFIDEEKANISKNEIRVKTELEGFEGKLKEISADVLESSEDNKNFKSELTERVDNFFENTNSAFGEQVREVEEIKGFKEELSKKVSNLEVDLIRNESHIKVQNESLDKIQVDVREAIEKLKINELEEKNASLARKVNYIQEVLEKFSEKEVLTESITEPPSTNNSDPLTPTDQNFVTFDQLQGHYRLLLNRIQQQLSTLGGGGETRLEFLDDVDRDTAKVNGKFLKYDSSVGKWVGANAFGGAGSQTLDETLGLGNTSSTGMSVGVVTATQFHGGGANITGISTLNIVNYGVGLGSQTLDETLGLGNTSSTGMSVGVLTASSFVKSGGTSSQFLKADGSIDTSTYLTSYTETQTLDDVLGLGNTSSTGLSVGVLTASSFVKSGGTSSQFLKADGSIDTSTYLTSYTETQTLDDVLGLGNTSSTGLSVGVVTATQFHGGGANITGISTLNIVNYGVGLGGAGSQTLDETLGLGNTSSTGMSVGVVTASSFVKSGGTSSQFLKADGSVDTSTYLTSYTETQTLDETLGLGNTSSTGMSVGVVTASSFVKSGGTSSQFLKADGSVDTSTYLTSYTETQTLDETLGLGNTSSTGMSVGVVTTTELHVGVDTGFFTEDLVVNGDARITGILSVGTATITLDPDANIVRIGTGITLNANTNSIEVGGSKIADTSGNAEYSGIVTASSFVGDVTGTATTATNLNDQAASYYLDYDNFTNTPTIPTNNNQLTNGAGYITTSFTNTNQLTNGAGYITTSFTNTNQLTNGAGFITSSDNITGTSGGLTGSPSITVTDITAVGNVSIAGTLTYEDVTNVDSIGIVTARTGLNVLSGGINVTGVSTFNSQIDVTGHTELDDVNVSGASTFTGNIDANGNLDVDGQTDLDILNVAELATFSANIDANGDLDVDGRTELDITNISETLNVVGIATFANNIDANGDLDVDGHTELDDVNVSGAITATTFTGDLTGNAGTATALETPRTFEITGDVVASAISFDGTGNVSLAATIQPNSVALATDTTGDFVQSITGTANEIEVTGGTGENSTPQIGLPNDVTIGQDLSVSRNINVSGVSTFTNKAEVRSDDGSPGRIDFYCEVNNAHYTRIQATSHANYGSLNPVVTLPAFSGTLLLTDGDGSSLTSLNASELSSGTIPDGRFPSILPAVSGASLTGLTGVSSGTYGDSSNVAAITVDTNGRITGITEVAISGGGGGGASEAFKTISVSGQSDVVADSATDTLTLVAGNNMTITTNATGDSITFASSGGGGGGGITRAQSIISAMVFS